MFSYLRNNYYFRRLWLFVVVYFILELSEMAVLVIRDGHLMDFSIFPVFEMLGDFLTESIISLVYWLLPFLCYLLLLPERFHLRKFDRIFSIIYFVLFVGINSFEEVAEFLFWVEFSSRFNFIAVDYLIYTKEVVGNIYQSYPLIWIIVGIALFSLFAAWLGKKLLFPQVSPPSWKVRAGYFSGAICVCIISFFGVDIKDAERGENRFNNELSKNGAYALFSAFLKNELNYQDFYITCDMQDAASFLRKELASPGMVFDEKGDSILRKTHPDRSPIEANVMVVIMESMGSEFLNENRTDEYNLTPNLTEFGKKGLFFPRTYATGTRSVRGLEAVTAAIPPLPGMSIVRRDNNNNIQTLGSIFSERGYETKWIYGGYGMFDNMNNFYQSNGFEIIDRTDMDDDEITHTTVWGVCDEDLFNRAIKESGKSYVAGKKFFNIVFTTSNHRPFTFPDGKIEISESASSREKAVKYADFSVGELVRQAQSQPWFDNTVFVFVADHGAGSAGKKELNAETHVIPLIIYAPKLIEPKRFDYPISQIDTAATLLGAMNIPCTLSSYGKDARLLGYKPRYFISNYQHIGYCEDDVLVIMRPVREVSYLLKGERVDESEDLKKYLDHAVKYYCHASDWKRHLSLERLGEQKDNG